jgi:hypothetical protein
LAIPDQLHANDQIIEGRAVEAIAAPQDTTARLDLVE